MRKIQGRFQHNRHTRSEWIRLNPILLAGELGLEIDKTGTVVRVKYGDGITRWMLLPYFSGDSEGTLALDDHINSLTPHPVYDDAPSLVLVYQNAKV